MAPDLVSALLNEACKALLSPIVRPRLSKSFSVKFLPAKASIYSY